MMLSRATGPAALLLAAMMLFVEVGLVAMALEPPALGPGESDVARARELAQRRDRVRVGLAVLVLGSAIAGLAVLMTRRHNSKDELVTAAGVCCIASVVTWLALVVTIYGNSVPKERDSPNSFTTTD